MFLAATGLASSSKRAIAHNIMYVVIAIDPLCAFLLELAHTVSENPSHGMFLCHSVMRTQHLSISGKHLTRMQLQEYRCDRNFVFHCVFCLFYFSFREQNSDRTSSASCLGQAVPLSKSLPKLKMSVL